MDIKKTLIGLSATAIILLSLFAPMLIVQPASSSSSPEYMTVSGVLATDTYILYPYKSKSLKIGFSKYGEMIAGDTNVGLEYDGVDPFANDLIIKSRWINGWLINITYYSTQTGRYRNVWACALFSDAVEWGGPWLRVDFDKDYDTYYKFEDPRDPGYVIGATPYPGTLRNGGRKTNGTAVTDDIKVLYDGPRLFVAQLSTTIYDHPVFLSDSRGSDVPLVKLVFTIIFEKVKKQVIVFKDVKSLLESKYGRELKVQFSNRGEVDLGKQVEPVNYLSNAYFWTQGTQAVWDANSDGRPTVYNSAWELSKTDDLGTWTLCSGYPQDTGATFDVAMAVNPTVKYVWWAAFWPSLSDYTIDGWDMWWRSMMETDPHDTSVRIADERVPFYIGEWDFKLDIVDAPTPVEGKQFRFITVYGLTDLNDGSLVDRTPDCDFADAEDTRVLDREVLYQLNEVFNPWDLNDAVHKDTSRYVKFVSGPLSSGANISLGEPLVDATWDAYCSFAERVILLPDKVLWKRGTQYVLRDGDGDGAYDSIRLLTSVASGKTLKILYSTSNSWSRTQSIDFEFFAEDSTELSGSGYKSWTDPLGVKHKVEVNDIDIVVVDYDDTVDFEEDFTWTLYGWETNFKVFKGSTYICSWDYYEPMLQEGEYANVSLDFLDIHWNITAPATEDVHVWQLGFKATVAVTVSYNATTNIMNITATVTLSPPGAYAGFNVLYSESIPGRYEWIIVGRDAHTVDSAGAALVAAAFKNKQVEIGLAGADMLDANVKMQMPWVMHKFGTGNAMADYKDAIGRAALRDDWCTTWPVASSNLIAVGGPIANLLAYYANDFTAALWGIPEYAASTWANKIIALSCWNKNAYASSETTGYAVVATYKDLNGTVIFLVWGDWGRDTYYATKWFHEEGIYQLQTAPDGATALILKIDYTKHPPTVSIVEVLGTISERLWTHGTIKKGGIHPDP